MVVAADIIVVMDPNGTILLAVVNPPQVLNFDAIFEDKNLRLD